MKLLKNKSLWEDIIKLNLRLTKRRHCLAGPSVLKLGEAQCGDGTMYTSQAVATVVFETISGIVGKTSNLD